MTLKTLEQKLSHDKMIILDESEQSAILEQPVTNNNFLLHSRAYFSKVNINPLVGAASPIFTLINRFKQQKHEVNIHDLRSNLAYEIQAFASRATHQGYVEKIVLAARYVLCAYVDDIISHSSIGRQQRWQQHSLMSIWQHEAYPGEQFFHLAERSSDEPELYIDLLELIYLCFRLGYEGIYRHMERGHAELLAVIDNLYHTIRHERGELSTNLLLAVKNQQPKLPKNKLSVHYLISIIFILIAILSSVVYFTYTLSATIKPTIQLINTNYYPTSEAQHGS